MADSEHDFLAMLSETLPDAVRKGLGALVERKRAVQASIDEDTAQLVSIDAEMHNLLGEHYARYTRAAARSHTLSTAAHHSHSTAVVPEPPIVQHPCMSWCASNSKPWIEKCGFAACDGCAECAHAHQEGDHGGNYSHHGVHSSHGQAKSDGSASHTVEGSIQEQSSIGLPCPENGVTACCKGDGFGAQYLALMSVFAYTIAMNVTFCTTPWTHVQHGVDALDAGNGAATMFDFVGGPLYGPPALPSTRKIESLYSDFATYATGRVYEKIRALYNASPRPPLRYFTRSDGVKSIAVHVRRGDVTPKDPERWTNVSDISSCLSKVIEEFAGANTSVHIFSDGTTEQLAGLQQHGPILHLRDNIKTAFHHMVKADALVTAKSSLSGTASILRSQGSNFPAHLGENCVD